MSWLVRRVGSPTTLPLPSAQAVLDGLKDGEWAAEDGVKGPGDAGFRPIERHPAFEAAVAELEEPPPPAEEETHLDMNPLIDVSLVLLIFFILTATYATLRRTIDLPPEPPDPKAERQGVVKLESLKDRAFKVVVRLDGDEPVARVEGKVVPWADLEAEMVKFVKQGRAEAVLDLSPDIAWDYHIRTLEATRGAEVRQVYWPVGK